MNETTAATDPEAIRATYEAHKSARRATFDLKDAELARSAAQRRENIARIARIAQAVADIETNIAFVAHPDQGNGACGVTVKWGTDSGGLFFAATDNAPYLTAEGQRASFASIYKSGQGEFYFREAQELTDFLCEWAARMAVPERE